MDLARAFSDLGITCTDLSEFCAEVDMGILRHSIPNYPCHKMSSHFNQSAITGKRLSRTSSDLDADSEGESCFAGYAYLPPQPLLKDEKGINIILCRVVDRHYVL